MKKHISEFGLDVYPSHKTLIPIEQLYKFNDEHAYHIYFILTSPKMIIKSDSLEISRDGICLNLLEIYQGKEKIHSIKSLRLGSFDHSLINLNSIYPYDFLEIIIHDLNYLKPINVERRKLQLPEINEYLLKIQARRLFNYAYPTLPFELRVEYIGQSFGASGEKTAIERLKNHAKFQEILTDCNTEFRDRHLYIFLMEIADTLHISLDGIRNEYSETYSDEELRIRTVLSNSPEYKQAINIAEAALINYFKPTYNKNFVENFPSKTHTGYSQYYDLDYNSLIVELDLDFDEPPQIQFFTDENRINSSFEYIQYNLSNDQNRHSMYDIFKKRK